MFGFKRKDRESTARNAEDSLRARAEQGDANAQFELAFSLSNGKKADDGQYLVDPNYVEAVKWWREAALRGDLRAQFNLSFLYATGLWTINGHPTAEEFPLLPVEEQLEHFRQVRVVANEGQPEAIKWLSIAADNGHAGAQWILGNIYQLRASASKEQGMDEKGQQELAEAIKWYEKAANAGHATAQGILGELYTDPHGFYNSKFSGFRPTPNPDVGVRWYRKAADQGVAWAQTDLGDMYAAGKGVPKNLAEAVRWYRAAAEQGSEEAQLRLGNMYAVGEGVPQNFGEAAKLFCMAAERYRWYMDDEFEFREINLWRSVDAEVKSWLFSSAENGWALAQTAIEGMHKEAVQDVFREVAEQGNANAQLAFGLFGRQSDNSKVEWLQKAARQGVAFAARLLADMYAKGKSVAKDTDQAEIYYRVAAELGDEVAQYEVGFILHHLSPNYGRGFYRWDPVFKAGPYVLHEPAADWYSKAAEQGHAQAQCQLAILYCLGQGVPVDYTRAATLFRSAAEQGYANAQYELAKMYSFGAGVPKDHDEATRWYRKAAKQGHKLARNSLERFDFAGDPLSQNGFEIIDWLKGVD